MKMAKNMCNSEGNLDDTEFSKPMPWIGIYIAIASLLCLISMSADLIKGFKARKLWFPSKYFCLNATSLTIIAVTVKLSVDLNTPMPHRHDQLAKLA
ncbi:plant/MNJ7-17 protein, partial [Trifolium pratense]